MQPSDRPGLIDLGHRREHDPEAVERINREWVLDQEAEQLLDLAFGKERMDRLRLDERWILASICRGLVILPRVEPKTPNALASPNPRRHMMQ